MTDRNEWEKKAANLLKAELTKRGLSYEALRGALEKIEIQKTTANLNKTINSGKFPFAFFLQCMTAIGITQFRLDDL